MVRPVLPPVRVVSGVDQRRPLGARLRGRARSMRPAVGAAMGVVVGLWPLWVIALFAFGLTWVFALAASP
jgi:hypothetical protein